MPPSSPSTEVEADDPQRGSAALEFIVVGMILLVPIVYLIVTLGLIQGQSLGAEAGARHIARAISTASDAASADQRADLVRGSVIEEYDLDAATVEVSLTCLPTGAECPEAGATVVVTFRTRVTLPLVPPVLGLEDIAAVPIEATAAHKVSRTWVGAP